MLNDKRKYALVGVVILAIGVGIGRFSKPAKVITKTEIKEVVKHIEKKDEQKNVVIYTKKITQKDGTVIEESKTEDKGTVLIYSEIESKKEVTSSSITIRDIGLSVHALAIQNIDRGTDSREYGFLVKKRLVGNISAGILATNKKTFGVSIGMDF